MRILIAFLLFVLSTASFAQTTSGPANGKSCSDLVQECVDYNHSRGHDTARCQGYKASCMKSGVYKDRNRTITGVAKR